MSYPPPHIQVSPTTRLIESRVVRTVSGTMNELDILCFPPFVKVVQYRWDVFPTGPPYN